MSHGNVTAVILDEFGSKKLGFGVNDCNDGKTKLFARNIKQCYNVGKCFTLVFHTKLIYRTFRF